LNVNVTPPPRLREHGLQPRQYVASTHPTGAGKMADYRQQRHEGRNDPRGLDRDYETHGGARHGYERDRSVGGFGRGSPRDRMGAEQFRPEDGGDHGERNYRDYGRGQPGGAYDHSGSRDYRHGSGYGGFGEAPGESGGGFGSGRTYAAEPGWGPDYGQYDSGRGGYSGQGAYPGSDGTPSGRFERPGRRSEDGQGARGFVQERRRNPAGHGYDSQYGPREQGRYGRGPKGYQRSDERLQEDICERLMADGYIDASEVTVAVKEGKVTLEGTVGERRMKHRIEDLVDECMGVKDIDNRIRVVRGFAGSGAETTLSIGGGGGQGGDAGASGGSGGFGA
jgi:osmotically-inducible protein OsmY